MVKELDRINPGLTIPEQDAEYLSIVERSTLLVEPNSRPFQEKLEEAKLLRRIAFAGHGEKFGIRRYSSGTKPKKIR